MQGIFKRYIVTAFNTNGGAYRYMSETEEDANRQAAIFADMGLGRVDVKNVLLNTRNGKIL